MRFYEKVCAVSKVCWPAGSLKTLSYSAMKHDNNLINLFEKLERQIVHIQFTDAEESWLKILDCSHVGLNGTVWADRVLSPKEPVPSEPHGIEFSISEIIQIKDTNNRLLFRKCKR